VIKKIILDLKKKSLFSKSAETKKKKKRSAFSPQNHFAFVKQNTKPNHSKQMQGKVHF